MRAPSAVFQLIAASVTNWAGAAAPTLPEQSLLWYWQEAKEPQQNSAH